MRAVAKKHLRTLKCLLRAPGLDVNLMSLIQPSTALNQAVKMNCGEIVRVLVNDPRTDVNLADPRVPGPLITAVVTANVKVLRLLLSRHDIDLAVYNEVGRSAVEIAQASHSPAVVKLLTSHLSPTARVIRDSDWIDAVKREAVDEVRRQLERHPALINTTTAHGETALFLSCARGDLALTRLLLSTPGVDINRANLSGYFPLIRAVSLNYSAVVAELSKRPELRVNARLPDGSSCLTMAAESGWADCVRLLLRHVDLAINRSRPGDGHSPLTLAVKHCHLSVVQQLLADPSLDVNHALSPPLNGLSAAMIAASDRPVNHHILSALLRDPRLNVNLEDSSGLTLLMRNLWKGPL